MTDLEQAAELVVALLPKLQPETITALNTAMQEIQDVVYRHKDLGRLAVIMVTYNTYCKMSQDYDLHLS